MSYAYNKTLGRGETDCMIQYIQKYYPIGEIYITKNNGYHIDKRDITYLQSKGKVYGCKMPWNLIFQTINTPYCYTTLLLESF